MGTDKGGAQKGRSASLHTSEPFWYMGRVTGADAEPLCCEP